MVKAPARGNPVNSGNGGIMGSGIFGMFGTTVVCDAKDTSFYCTFMKYVTFMISLLMIMGILYFAYILITPVFGKSKRR